MTDIPSLLKNIYVTHVQEDMLDHIAKDVIMDTLEILYKSVIIANHVTATEMEIFMQQIGVIISLENVFNVLEIQLDGIVSNVKMDTLEIHCPDNVKLVTVTNMDHCPMNVIQ